MLNTTALSPDPRNAALSTYDSRLIVAGETVRIFCSSTFNILAAKSCMTISNWPARCVASRPGGNTTTPGRASSFFLLTSSSASLPSFESNAKHRTRSADPLTPSSNASRACNRNRAGEFHRRFVVQIQATASSKRTERASASCVHRIPITALVFREACRQANGLFRLAISSAPPTANLKFSVPERQG